MDCPEEKLCVTPESTRESSSANSREPDESLSRAPKTAFKIACGATCPVIERKAASNSIFERAPFPSVSNFEKRVSAV